MGTLRKEAVVGVTCWELKSHLFKASVLPTFTYGTYLWGGDLKNSHWEVFEKGLKIHMLCHVKMRSSTTLSYCAGQIWRTSHEIIRSKANYELKQWLAHLPSSWLLS